MEKRKKSVPSGKVNKSGTSRSRPYLMGIAIGVGITIVVAWLFYDSFWGLLLGVVFVPIARRFTYRQMVEKERWNSLVEFKEMLTLLSSFMQAGVSIENAFLDVELEMRHLLGEGSVLQRELHRMNEKIKMNVSVEKAFYELAGKLKLEEAREFADVLYYAKRLGGNYINNVRQTATKIEDKMEVKQEIEILVAQKRLEFKVMVAMPIFILAYIKLSSMDFISALYHEPVGVFLMTLCLCFYFFMIWLGYGMVQIEV